MHVAVMAALAAFTLTASNAPPKSGCITQAVDKSERAETLRSRAIADFVERQIIYKITKTSETGIEVQITSHFLELPFDMKQVVAWAVFSRDFDGADPRQAVVFIDSRTLERVGQFDPCHGLALH